MATLPQYANKDLVAAALLMGGMSPDEVATRFQRAQDNPQAVLDALASANDSGLKKLGKLVTGYVQNPGTGHLTDLLKNAGIDENIIGTAISNVQGPNPNQTRPTPAPEQVLASINQLGGGNLLDTVYTGLQQSGVGRSGLTTTREQYLFGPGPASAPAAAPSPVTPAPAPGPGSPNQAIPTAHPASGEPKGIPLPPDRPGTKPAAGAATGGQQTPGGGVTPGGGGGPDNKVTAGNPANWNDDKIKTWLKQNLGGTDAWFIDIPEVWNAMSNAVRAGKNATQVDGAFMDTQFYKQNGAASRGWYAKQRSDPAQAAADVAQETQHITNQAQQAGITLDPDRAGQMAQSYLRFGWTDTDLQRAIGAEWHYDPATKQQASAVTQMKAQARDWLVPLSDDAIQTWGQGLISGSVTQDQWTQYLRDSAKSLMPQLATLIDQHAGDPRFSVSTFADPYKQHAVNLLGIQADQIDLNDPSNKWRQALDTVDPKTGERRIMSLSEWDTKLKTDKQYGYDKTANGINDGLQLAQSLKQSMGF